MTREALIARLVAKRETVDAKWDPYTVWSKREVKARHERTQLAVTLIVDEVLGELGMNLGETRERPMMNYDPTKHTLHPGCPGRLELHGHVLTCAYCGATANVEVIAGTS